MFSGNRSLASNLCRALFVTCALTALCFLAPALSSAAQVTLAWDPNTEPDLAGYKVYYSTTSVSYQYSVYVGNLTSYTLSGLLYGRIYYFAATAYNLNLNESGFSNEVSKAIADVTPPTVSMTAPAAGATVSGTMTVSASATDNVGIVGVQLKLDGVNLGAEDTTNAYSISWNSTLAANGTHTLTAVARDAAGNTATSAAVSVTVDNTPPIISSVSAFNISSSQATITWATNQASDSQVEYGLTTAYGSSTPLNSSLLTAHAVTLTGLLASNTYHYRVQSRDAAGTLATSADFTLTTLIAVPDITPPSVPTNLSASAMSSLQMNLSWTASTDNVGVAGYTIYRGGSQIATTSLTSYSDTGLSPSTAYAYTVAAYDAAGNVSVQAAPASAVTLDLTCVISAGSWQNVAFAAQSGAFAAEFDATPNNAAMDGVMGLSNGPAAAYSSLAAIVRFNASGMIDAINGGVYAASAAIPYSAGTTYHVRFVVSVPAHTYSVYVRSGSNAEQLLASNFSFRTEQAAASALNNLGLYASVGSETVCNLAVTCVTSAGSWQNIAFAAQSGAFAAEFDATPNNAAMDGVMGLSNGPAAAYSSLAAIVRFNASGMIDAINGGVYAASAAIPYSAGTTYHVRFVVSVPAHTYSVYVRSGSDAEQLLASNFSFRTEQAAASALNNLGLYASVGSETVCMLVVTVANDTTPPMVSMTAPAAGSTVAGTVTVSVNATDNVGVAGVQFKLDGANLGTEVTAAPYTTSWNTTLAAIGVHTLTAVARDAAGNTATAPAVSLTVVRKPTITSFTPTSGPVGTMVTISGTDFTGVTAVTFNGVNGDPFTVTSATAIQDSVPMGATTGPLSVTTTGGMATSASVFTVVNDATPPAVSITAPVAGATVTGTITVSVSAADNVGVVGVQFKLACANPGTEVTTAPYLVSWNPTLATSGAHHLTAVARDAAGNTATSVAISVTVRNDTTPPTVSMTAPAAGATVGGTITVSASATDDVGVVGVQFKLDGVNLGSLITAAPYTLAWITTTASNGAHTLTAVARDAARNTATSSSVTVTVFNDSTPPAFSLTAPAKGATVAGTVTISASATDNVGVVGVQFMLDGANLGAEVTTAPYATSWNTALASAGAHILTAVARDAAGNMATTASVSITVADTTPPAVSMTAPSSGSTVSGIVTVSATASDNVGVVGVQFKLDGVNLGAELTAAPYSISWTTTTASNGAHSLTAVARDAAGNTATAVVVSVTVFNDTTPPTVSMTAPSTGATVSGTITVSADATDNVGVAGLQFKLDGVNLGAEVTIAPYTLSWNTATASNGLHTLTAVARDAAGNSTTSAGVSITVADATVSITAPLNDG